MQDSDHELVNDVVAALTDLPSIPSTEDSKPNRFAREVRGLLEKRAEAGWQGERENDVAAFILVDYPRDIGSKIGAIRVVDLPVANVNLFGRLFLLSQDATNGYFIELPCAEHAVLDWLIDNSLRDVPVVLAYRGTSTMTIRNAPHEATAREESVRSFRPTATLEELLAALKHFHAGMVTPKHCPKGVWHTAREYVPAAEPERQIQEALRFALDMYFRGVLKAEVEDSTPIGRIDVRLLMDSNGGPLYYWAIVELKVIRSKRHCKNGNIRGVGMSVNINAIAEGVRQTNAYRANRRALQGLLEIFDLRDSKVKDLVASGPVQAELSNCNPQPTVNVRPMFGSAADARRAGFT